MSAVPYLPGPVGRFVRLALGLLVTQSAVGAIGMLADGVSGLPDVGDQGLVIAIAIAAWLTPAVFDIGLGTAYGNRWRAAALAFVAVATLVGLAIGAPGTGLTTGVLSWVSITLGWLGISFLLSALLRTPGCEMRAPQHLASLVLPGHGGFIACPGPLQPLDEWEARSTGRAEPYVPG